GLAGAADDIGAIALRIDQFGADFVAGLAGGKGGDGNGSSHDESNQGSGGTLHDNSFHLRVTSARPLASCRWAPVDGRNFRLFLFPEKPSAATYVIPFSAIIELFALLDSNG